MDGNLAMASHMVNMSENDMNELHFDLEKGKARNKSTLSAVDCHMRLTDPERPFESMSDDDLDSIYFIAFGRWAYHLTRQAYIDSLNKRRLEIAVPNPDVQHFDKMRLNEVTQKLNKIWSHVPNNSQENDLENAWTISKAKEETKKLLTEYFL